MKFYLISDNIDTQVGMRLVGIEGVVVHEKDEFLEELEKALANEQIAIIMITTKLVSLAPNIVSEKKLKETRALIVEIPDRHGESKVGESIDKYVSEAIGVKL
ncbi:V-type ATP synthase subunit F [Acholeplasma sp. OttesenSCG-928-E16]|nr:V-type ATP synthase subunit F [Acholeplasma sp. OttesenSCG-928-E16]